MTRVLFTLGLSMLSAALIAVGLWASLASWVWLLVLPVELVAMYFFAERFLKWLSPDGDPATLARARMWIVLSIGSWMGAVVIYGGRELIHIMSGFAMTGGPAETPTFDVVFPLILAICAAAVSWRAAGLVLKC